MSAAEWRKALALAVLAITAAPAAADTPVTVEELGGSQCYAHGQLAGGPKGLVVDSAADYAKLFDPALRRQSCSAADATKTIVPVDFTHKTVLGFWTAASCADAGFDHRVLRDDAGKLLRYTVIIRPGPKPACMGPGPESLNLIAIDKTPPGYKIVFDTVHE